jgi:nucleoside-diphosphate-sugar epimerase
MNILLTGSNGFLGKYIFDELSKFANIFTLNRNNSNYNYILGENQIIFDKKFDIVVHSAGKAHAIFESESEINSLFNINVKGTYDLLKGLEKSGIPEKFVFISSVSVYGLIQGIDILENFPLAAEDPYGKSKIEAEEIIRNWCFEQSVVCTILRLPLVVGIDPPGNLGAMIKGIKKNYYFNVSGGTAKKSMVHASDVARFILKSSEIGGIYNLTDGVHSNFKDLSKLISTKLKKKFVPNLPLFLVFPFAKIGDIIGSSFPINSNKLLKIVSTLTFNDQKARISFGWKPTPVLETFKLTNDV